MNETLKQIKIIKNGKKITNEELSNLSGVPLGTVNKILSGATKSVKTQTLEKLKRALQEQDFDQIENFGFYKVGAYTPEIVLASPQKNAEIITEAIKKASKKGISLLVFPKLCLAGSTLGSLYMQKALLNSSVNALFDIAEKTKNLSIISVVGAPLMINSKIYSVGAVIYGGSILGLVPENDNQNSLFSSFYGFETISILGKQIPFGNMMFSAENLNGFTFGVSFSSSLINGLFSNYGENITACLSAINESVNKTERVKTLLSAKSHASGSAIILAEAGFGESTTDYVFSGVNLIYENGNLLTESKPFSSGLIYNDVDVEFLQLERCKKPTEVNSKINIINFNFNIGSFNLSRTFDKMPFVPKNSVKLRERAELILNIQANALKRRIEHTKAKTLVIGVSGGLDSTLALLVAVRAVKLLGQSTKSITAITMPCFGTTGRTKNNANNLSSSLNVVLKEINIKSAVIKHFEDIEHDVNVHDVTFENSQARERTQVLLDYANKTGGLVVGTGDLSELALGWATFNGDHISNYGVNASIPKTLIRYLVWYEANNSKGLLKQTLLDILDTPVSPELIPPSDDKITQKTEDLVGPYILHDFFLYYAIRRCYNPSKIFYIAKNTFKNEYSAETVYKWLENFYKRFFAQQFKRSCLPDGVKVGSVSLSPRGDFMMPSDAYNFDWLSDLQKVKP